MNGILSRLRPIAFILAFGIVAWIAVVRIVEIRRENARVVFNPIRDQMERGVPVEVLEVVAGQGTLREPVAVRCGRIFVTEQRVRKFRVGQNISGGGRITSVSRSVDLGTGLFLIRASGRDGDHFVMIEYRGVFVPLSAISGLYIMVADAGVAVPRRIEIVAEDASQAVIRGIPDGELIILTRVDAGTKIRPVNRR